MMARQLPRRTREALAACEAVGLMFWADHPWPRQVWAVDDHQRVHVVRIGRDASTVQHMCQASSDEQSAGFIELEDEADRDVDRLNTR